MRFEKEGFGEIIDGFRQLRIFWHGRELELHLDADSQPEVAERIRKNPARGLALFGAVKFLGQNRGIRADLTTVLSFKFLQRPFSGGLTRNILVVVFRTRDRASQRFIVGKKELRDFPASYVFA
ncbi:MAG: hypothetical protein NTW66_01035 [Candidatus Magasanikbacteria bacterium]|nr:hypothetical protein [Candidatus Magasanikbacteria bacterium]